MDADSARLERPHRPRYIPPGVEEIEALAISFADFPAAGPCYLEGHRALWLRHPSEAELARGEHCQDLVDSVEQEIG